jgi:hypothetical protein
MITNLKLCKSCEQLTEHRWLNCAGDCECEHSLPTDDGLCETCGNCVGGSYCNQIICIECGESYE